MRNKTLVAHHRAPKPRAAHPPSVPRTHYHYCHTIVPDLQLYESKTGRPGVDKGSEWILSVARHRDPMADPVGTLRSC